MRGERPTYGHVGEMVRRFRLRSGHTQAWVAYQLYRRDEPIDQGQVSQIEKGRRLPDVKLLAALADTLDIPRDEIVIALAAEYDTARMQ